MRLFVLSDLHLEKRSLSDVRTPDRDYDVLVCAGDVWEGQPAGAIQALVRLAAGRPVLVVPGNHDCYRAGPDDRRSAAQMVELMRAEADRVNASGSGSVTLLEGGAQTTIGAVTFVGATLWTDWALAGLWRPGADAGAAVLDAILSVTNPATGSREYRGSIFAAPGEVWQPHDAYRQHRHDREALRRTLLLSPGPLVVVVTHHAPLTEILEPYRGRPGVPWWIPAFYASRLLADLPQAVRPALWVSGHFHARHDLRIADTRCVANPVAAADYDPDWIIDLDRVAQPGLRT